jgi:ureidoglycolate lyase
MAEPDVISLRPLPLTQERFAPYGDVIEASHDGMTTMNDARFERFDSLCNVDVDGDIAINVTRCRTPTALPLRVDKVERHPLGSQAFVPLSPCRMVVVVAPPGESVSASDLRAFVSNGRQGINYHRGTWHMPLVAFDAGQQFLVVDRRGDSDPNCEVHELDEVVMLEDAR